MSIRALAFASTAAFGLACGPTSSVHQGQGQGGSSPGSGGSGNGGAPSSGGSTTAQGGLNSGGAGLGGSGSGGAAKGGSSSGAAASTGGSSATACGTRNAHPFGCNFAWGIAAPSGSLTSYTYLQFMSQWVGSEVKADGSLSSCSGCSWLTNQVSKTNLIPAFYAYFIGFYGHANGLPDGNQTSGQSLVTGGAALIKANRAKVVQMYAWYAQQVYKVWPTKPLVWLLEGDYVQYSGSSQSSPLSYAELGQLAADITCAIKSNMPNAVVAIDHSSWNADEVTKSFWNAMAVANYDLVWTTGVGNNKGFIEPSATSTTYNHATATYAFLRQLTGRPILVDTSAGASAAGDSWSTASVADLNARASEGVIAANITGTAPSGLQANISSRSLNALPSCP
ncbi:MAG: hypothetical protein QM756_41355 [Polyangiaceae bacterium]